MEKLVVAPQIVIYKNIFKDRSKNKINTFLSVTLALKAKRFFN